MDMHQRERVLSKESRGYGFSEGGWIKKLFWVPMQKKTRDKLGVFFGENHSQV